MYVKIGKVAREVGLSVKRIQEYEKENLIKPLRKKSSNHRLFSTFEINQIKRIKHLIHDRGFTLTSIKHLLNMAPCWLVLECEHPEICPAYHNPHKRCWEVKKSLNINFPCMGTCERCPVFLVRNYKSKPLFEKTPKFNNNNSQPVIKVRRYFGS